MPDFPGTFKPPRLAAPPGSPVVGQMYYDTGTNLLYYWNGTAWVSATAQGLSSNTFEYVYSGILTAPPASGELRFNAASAAASTSFFASDVAVAGANVSSYLNEVKRGMHVLVLAKADPTRGVIATNLTQVIDQTAYVEYRNNSFTVLGSGLVSGERVVVSFVPVEQVPTPLSFGEGKWLGVQGGAMVWSNPAIADVTGLQAQLGTYGTTPPASPADGDEWILPADATNGIMWRFRYRAASASAYKWEFVGGPPLTAFNAAQESGTSLTFADTATLTAVIIPRSGDYMVKIGANHWLTGPSSIAVTSPAGAGYTPTDSWTWSNVQTQNAVWAEERVNALTAGGALKHQYRLTAAGTMNWNNRHLQITPIRVS